MLPSKPEILVTIRNKGRNNPGVFLSKIAIFQHMANREKKMDVVLAIMYAPDGHRPLAIARVNDRRLLAEAAERAVYEAEVIATELMEGDRTLGALQLEEVNKLRRVLGLLLPQGKFSHGVM
jgi:hypothetical protein